MSATKVPSKTKPILIGVGVVILILIAVYFFIGRSEDTISMAPAPVVTEAEKVEEVATTPEVVQVVTLAPPVAVPAPPVAVPAPPVAVAVPPVAVAVPPVAVAVPPAVAVPAVAVPKGRFIKLIQTVAYDENDTNNKNKIINLAELEVFDANGVNLASGKTVTGSSEYSAEYGYVNLTDGIKTNFAHTKGRNVNEYDYLQVDLGALKDIKKIVITNRPGSDAVKDRAIGIKAIIYANNGITPIRETPVITTRANTYTLTFPANVWS